MTIRSAAVLGAGTMGSQIAAHLANAGVPALLLDVTPAAARQGLERARRLRPDPFFTPDAPALVTTGGFDEDLHRISTADWIVEAIIEQIEPKQALLARVESHRAPGSIVSSNTSGIPIAEIARGRSADLRRHWLGTHFFNPPRYLRLLEVIPTADTDAAVVERLTAFADRRLGKGVVLAKDTPGFIGNRIGLYGLLRVLEALESGQYAIEEIDAMTGPAIGRPKSATFRTLDLAGLDILGHVARDLAVRLPGEDERAAFKLPRVLEELLGRGWIGEKAGSGFYRKEAVPDGSRILTLDPGTMTYRAAEPVRLAALDAVRPIEDAGERLRTLFGDRSRAGDFMRRTLVPTLIYAARVAPDVAHSPDDIDRAMQWGFGWELGPFEIWDAIGIEAVLAACGVDPAAAPPMVREALGRPGGATFRDGRVPPAAPDLQILRAAKERSRLVRRNAGASLIDLGDGVLGVEFHSKMNAIGGDTIEMLNAGVTEASANFAALVVGNEAANFSVGANLMLLLLEAQEENWDEIDLIVRAFQQATMGLRYSGVPVVVAPAGLTLGGGCEIALHGDRVQAAGETYLGLVEVGVGLIPAGGGTKEMLARGVERLPPGTSDLLPAVQHAFETIGFARVSASGPDARRLGYLRDADGITMNRERLIADAKAAALTLARGYRPPVPKTDIPVGGEGVFAALRLGVHLARRAGRISDHDAVIGSRLAWILAGGSLPHAARVSEQYLLDLEREAFLALCGEPKTQERIQHTLKTGKTLRN